MMKLLHTLRSGRDHFSRKLLFWKAADAKDAICLHALASRAGISTANQNFAATGPAEQNSERLFVDYSIFKGKAALTVRPILPVFTKMDSGGLKVDRRGVLMLRFAPAIGERKYDWEKKQVFALSATEMGSLISIGPNDSCEFFHDPSMLSSNAGQVRKNLSIKPNDSGYFISLSVAHNILKTNDRFNVPVTTAEFAVLKTACSFALPHIMGWGRYTSQSPSWDSSSKIGSKLSSSEWDK